MAQKHTCYHHKYQHYTAFVLFGACTGQRSLATISELTIRQFRERSDLTSCIEVKSSQDKIKMQHYEPLHPQAIQAVQPLLEERDEVGLCLNTPPSYSG